MPKILLVKTTSLGDVIHNLPVVSDLTLALPDANIHWVVEDSFADIPALHPSVTRIIPVSLRRWRRNIYRPSIWCEIAEGLRALRSETYDYIIDTQGLLKSALIASRAKGAVYGQNRGSAREPVASRFYDHGYEIDRNQHAVPRNRQLAAAVFGYESAAMPLNYGIEHSPRLAPVAWSLPSRYVVFLHGTSRDSKLWPIEHWIELGGLLSSTGLAVVLPWGNRVERERAKNLAANIKGALMAPELKLDWLATVLAGASCVVGVDTGPTHLAVALNRPTAAIYTDTDPAKTGVLPMDPARAVNLGNCGRAPAVADVLHAIHGMPDIE